MSRDYILQPFQSHARLRIDYAAELNEQQHAAVTAPPGPSLVIAGAGSGKTRTLTYRVAYLLEQGIPPERVLLLTFTNKAAKEMMRRVADLLGQQLAALWGGTFHSIGNRILRSNADLLGYGRDFTILDRDDAEHLLKTCMAESDIDSKATRFPKAAVVGDVLSLAVNTRKTVREILDEQFNHFSHLADDIEGLRTAYSARKRASNTLDFDDLLGLWLRLLENHAEVREHWQRRFQFVLVDEYQDTNKLQSDLIDLLAARHHNLMVVGDDAQSIYAWRGANYRNIFEFPKRYPEAVIYRIETNYRSTPEILEVANAAIKANENQFAKVLTAARKSGLKPALVPCEDALHQAEFVARRVLDLREEGAALDRMAVLYRSHFHALELQLELTRRNIPFAITSGIRFFEQAHIKDLTAFLKLVVNPRDELAFKRVAQLLRGIGPKAAHKLWTCFEAQPVAAATSHPAANAGEPRAPVPCHLEACASAVPKKASTAWAQLAATVAQMEDAPIRGNPSEMLRVALEAVYEDYLQEKYPNYRARLDDLRQLTVFARQFSTAEEFLTQLALLTNLDAEEQQPADRDEEQLRLSTIHQAKGLEFDVVFVIMLCEGLFPSARSLEIDRTAEEERRLMYVAVTRARSELYLCYPLVRAGYGAGATIQHPSRFLQEIPIELLEEWNLRRG